MASPRTPNSIKLGRRPQPDPLESSANAVAYLTGKGLPTGTLLREAAAVVVKLELPFNNLRTHSASRKLDRSIRQMMRLLDELPSEFRAKPAQHRALDHLVAALREAQFQLGANAPPIIDTDRWPPKFRETVFAYDQSLRKLHPRAQFIGGLYDRRTPLSRELELGPCDAENLSIMELMCIARAVGLDDDRLIARNKAKALDLWEASRDKVRSLRDKFKIAMAEQVQMAARP